MCGLNQTRDGPGIRILSQPHQPGPKMGCHEEMYALWRAREPQGLHHVTGARIFIRGLFAGSWIHIQPFKLMLVWV